MKKGIRKSREEVLASMTSDNFRIDRVKSTPAEIRHATHRINTMKYKALEGRIAHMTDPFKLIAFIRACTKRGLKSLADDTRIKLNIVLNAR